ncbi:MAG: cobalamin-dependent protein [Bacteroidota bacterium]
MKTALMNTSNVVDDNKAALGQLVTELQFKNNPGLLLKYGVAGKGKCCEDNLHHFSYLSVAMQLDCTEIFAAYIAWAQKMLEARNIPVKDLSNNLDYMDIACKELLPGENYDAAHFCILESKERIKNTSTDPETYFNNDNPLLNEAKKYLDFLLKGNKIQALALITALVKNGNQLSSVYDNIFKVTQHEIGLRWQNNIITVAHEHYCTAATQSIMATLYAHIFTSAKKGRKMVACGVSGDLHEIGIRMLSDLFELDGWDSYYMGANMPEANIISALAEQNPQLLAISVTVPFHIIKVRTLIKNIRNNISLDNIKIMVGGYPFALVKDLWRKVGADAFAPNAKEAIKLANNMIF